MKFIFGQLEDPNFENFLWEYAPTSPVSGLGVTVDFTLSLEESWNSQEILSFMKNGDPVVNLEVFLR